MSIEEKRDRWSNLDMQFSIEHSCKRSRGGKWDGPPWHGTYRYFHQLTIFQKAQGLTLANKSYSSPSSFMIGSLRRMLFTLNYLYLTFLSSPQGTGPPHFHLISGQPYLWALNVLADWVSMWILIQFHLVMWSKGTNACGGTSNVFISSYPTYFSRNFWFHI